jgi:hypothetical protein
MFQVNVPFADLLNTNPILLKLIVFSQLDTKLIWLLKSKLKYIGKKKLAI